MNTQRMSVGGVQVYRDLGMISILGTPQGPGMAGEVLETLGEAGINEAVEKCARTSPLAVFAVIGGPEPGVGQRTECCGLRICPLTAHCAAPQPRPTFVFH
jgi:hypothetical protein